MKKLSNILLLCIFSFASIPMQSNAESIDFHMPFEELQHKYEQNNAWGLVSSIDLHDCDPELVRSSDAIKEYVLQLCDLIEMKRFGETIIVHFGEDEAVEDSSMLQLIETSLIFGHFANATNAIYLDIFSCKVYDPYVAAEVAKSFFKAKDYTITITMRK